MLSLILSFSCTDHSNAPQACPSAQKTCGQLAAKSDSLADSSWSWRHPSETTWGSSEVERCFNRSRFMCEACRLAQLQSRCPTAHL